MQAVNRKAEGIEPRKPIDGKDDAFRTAEAHMGVAENGLALPVSPGSVTMACMTRRQHGNPGGPACASMEGRGL